MFEITKVHCTYLFTECVSSYCAVPWAGRACSVSLCVHLLGGSVDAALDWACTAASEAVASYCCSCTQRTAKWLDSSSPHSAARAMPPCLDWQRTGCHRRHRQRRFHLLLSGQEATSSPAPPLLQCLPLRLLAQRFPHWLCVAPHCWGGSAGADDAAEGYGLASATMHYLGLSLRSPCWNRGYVHYPRRYCLHHCH